MDWHSDLTQNAVPIEVKNYKRYNNPYGAADFPGDKIELRFKGNSLALDFKTRTRRVINAKSPSAN